MRALRLMESYHRCISLLYNNYSGQLVEGQCGRHCMGGPADTIGVIEFDPDSGTVVGEHKFVGSGPIDSPFASRDGGTFVLVVSCTSL